MKFTLPPIDPGTQASHEKASGSAGAPSTEDVDAIVAEALAAITSHVPQIVDTIKAAVIADIGPARGS